MSITLEPVATVRGGRAEVGGELVGRHIVEEAALRALARHRR